MKTALKRAKLRSVATSKGKDARRMQNSLKKHRTPHFLNTFVKNAYEIYTIYKRAVKFCSGPPTVPAHLGTRPPLRSTMSTTRVPIPSMVWRNGVESNVTNLVKWGKYVHKTFRQIPSSLFVNAVDGMETRIADTVERKGGRVPK